MSDYMFDYSVTCQPGGCGAQIVVPVREIVANDGAFHCPHCGKAYEVEDENLRLLAGLLAKNFSGDEGPGHVEKTVRP